MHGTRGTTGCEGCLLLYSGTGKSLIFHPFVSLAKFEAGKPGGESVSVLRPGVHRCVPTHCRCFPRNPGGESGGAVLYSTALPAFSGKHRGNRQD